MRLQPELLDALDIWLSSQDDRPSRPEAVRRLLERALESS